MPEATASLLRGRYKIIKPLAKGGFGQTFLAADLDLPGNPHCVVKQLKLTLPEARRLFETEAQIQYKLGCHNQIPSIFAHFEENQKFYLVQELIEGHELSQEIILGKLLSETQVIAILHDVLQVLEFVHQQQVIHRDIKPSNLIRRQRDGKLVLIDFGAVKEIHNSAYSYSKQPDTITIIGTIGYAPPEQMMGSPSFYSDIYALGMIGIQALTGVLPLELVEPGTHEIVWRNQVQVRTEVVDILDKMVRFDFNERYQSATEVLQAIEDLYIVTPAPYSVRKKTIVSQFASFFDRFKS